MRKRALVIGFDAHLSHILDLVDFDDCYIVLYHSAFSKGVPGAELIELLEVFRDDFDLVVYDDLHKSYAEWLSYICDIGKKLNLEEIYYKDKDQVQVPRIAAKMHQLEAEAMRSIMRSGSYQSRRPNYWVGGWSFYEKDYVDSLKINKDYLMGAPDYPRLQAVYEASKQLSKKRCCGAVAELGVYKGDFSSFLSRMFPSEDFYLFDTFVGFDTSDVCLDKGLSRASEGYFGDTTVPLVRSKILNPERCHWAIGHFPGSCELAVDVEFKFVNIDVDLYEPTKSGLNFFYDRLVPGGYIMIHDYLHPGYRGPQKAVDEFCQQRGIAVFPVADFNGSVMISK